mmetsp:Transcript_6564/g.11906  ORF Transcript_6564/g.11906 Transcript_6564/m.11906 type:complete len:297 (+) Transcript_6564:569-1459(+)
MNCHSLHLPHVGMCIQQLPRLLLHLRRAHVMALHVRILDGREQRAEHHVLTHRPYLHVEYPFHLADDAHAHSLLDSAHARRREVGGHLHLDVHECRRSHLSGAHAGDILDVGVVRRQRFDVPHKLLVSDCVRELLHRFAHDLGTRHGNHSRDEHPREGICREESGNCHGQPNRNQRQYRGVGVRSMMPSVGDDHLRIQVFSYASRDAIEPFFGSNGHSRHDQCRPGGYIHQFGGGRDARRSLHVDHPQKFHVGRYPDGEPRPKQRQREKQRSDALELAVTIGMIVVGRQSCHLDSP